MGLSFTSSSASSTRRSSRRSCAHAPTNPSTVLVPSCCNVDAGAEPFAQRAESGGAQLEAHYVKTLQQLFLTNIFLSNFYISVPLFVLCDVELLRYGGVSRASFAAAYVLRAIPERSQFEAESLDQQLR